MSKIINVGIIGCGKIAQTRHIPEIAALPGAALAGYYDKNAARAKDLTQKYGGRVFCSAGELIASDGIDAVVICLPNFLHAATAIAALKAGKHVLCEKPMADSLSDCVRMARAAKGAGKILMTAFNERFEKAHIKAEKLLSNGAIGKVLTFDTRFCHSGPDNWSIDGGAANWFFDKAQVGFGAMFDLGVHKVNIISFLLGEDIKSVKATFATLDKKTPNGEPIPVEDNALCILRTASGAAGTLTAGWTRYGKYGNTTALYGTEGVMIIEPARVTVYRKDKTKSVYRVDKAKTSGVAEAFIKAVKGNTPPPCAPDETLSTMRTVFAAIKSAESGKEEKTGN